MKFRRGDKVSFMNENRRAVVTRISAHGKITVRDEEGFEISCRENEIVLLPDALSFGRMENFQAEKKDADNSPVRSPRKNMKRKEVWEVDLHFEELAENDLLPGGYEKLSLQLKHFKKIMDVALQQNIKKVIFIHGTGKGVLKNEIIRELKNYESVKFYDSPRKKYGTGAITVELGVY